MTAYVYHLDDETETQNVQIFTFHSSFVGVISFIAEWWLDRPVNFGPQPLEWLLIILLILWFKICVDFMK